MSRRSWLNTAVVILVVAAGTLQGESELNGQAAQRQPAGKAATAVKPISGVDRSYMDLTVSPCKDFYAYANGAFEKVPIPGEYAAYGVNQEIDEQLRDPQNPRTCGAERRPQGQRGPAGRRFLCIGHG